VQVPLPTPPSLHDPPGSPPVQSHLQGWQDSPGAQAGQAHVQVPPPMTPPPVPPLPVPPGGIVPAQSHWTAGQSAFAGQASG
jgi:hypothetical protein